MDSAQKNTKGTTNKTLLPQNAYWVPEFWTYSLVPKDLWWLICLSFNGSIEIEKYFGILNTQIHHFKYLNTKYKLLFNKLVKYKLQIH